MRTSVWTQYKWNGPIWLTARSEVNGREISCKYTRSVIAENLQKLHIVRYLRTLSSLFCSWERYSTTVSESPTSLRFVSGIHSFSEISEPVCRSCPIIKLAGVRRELVTATAKSSRTSRMATEPWVLCSDGRFNSKIFPVSVGWKKKTVSSALGSILLPRLWALTDVNYVGQSTAVWGRMEEHSARVRRPATFRESLVEQTIERTARSSRLRVLHDLNQDRPLETQRIQDGLIFSQRTVYKPRGPWKINSVKNWTKM